MAVYEERFKKWTSPEGLAIITGMCREGYTNKMVAARIGINIQTLYKWRKKSNDLDEAIKQGKQVADYMVENALFKAAIGFEHTETKTYITGQPDKAGNRNVKVEKTTKYFPPNATAMIFWLCNRKSDQWKRNRDNAFQLNDDESSITINVVKHSDAEKEKEEGEAKKETVGEDEFKEYDRGYAESPGEVEEDLEDFNYIGKETGLLDGEVESDWGEDIYEG